MSKNQTANKIAQGRTKGMVNAFICPDLHSITTKNADDGIIPNQISCPQCGQTAMSMMYQVNQNLGAVVEWYRPTLSEMDASSISMTDEQFEGRKKYISNGGLLSRKIGSNEG
jgi:hypothetical protein